ncbi:MAG: hypothetical protein JNM63_15155 [Spirochaetia bacterium]|nr:hypothetical protein [Spirochaetia bacterium]
MSPIPPSTNAVELGKLIHLPAETRSVLWQAGTVGSVGLGPTDWRLDAVFEFQPGAGRKILTAMPTLPGPGIFPGSFLQDWYPAGLVRLFQTNSDGTLTLRLPSRDASLFYKSPLLDGFALPLADEDRIFIHLDTK